jgi:all-trans-retinol 13,14-reductase
MLLKAFPHVDPKALDKYYQKCRYARLVASITFLLKCLPPFLTRIVWSLGYQYLFQKVCLGVTLDVMRNDCGLPDDVIGAILYSYGDYGTPPSESPFFVQAFMESHYDGGAFFPKGGSTSIAKTLVAAIQRRGGKVFAAAPVETIITKKDAWGRETAVGVCVRGVKVLSRKGVISGAGFARTFETGSGGVPPLVTDEQASAAQLALIHSNGLVQSPLKPSNAFFYLFVGLNGTDEELGLPAQNIWHLQSWNHDELFQEMLNTESIDEALKTKLPLVFLSNESAKDPDYQKRHPGKSTITMVAWTNPQWFSTWSDTKHGNRGQDYEAIKAKMTKQLLEVLYLHFPKTKGKVAVTELGTPLSVNKYLGRINGEIYNLDHNVSRFDSLGAQLALHPQTTIKNLYLTGQDANFVSIEGATMSGFFTAARFSIFAFLFAYLPLVLSCIPGFIWY